MLRRTKIAATLTALAAAANLLTGAAAQAETTVGYPVSRTASVLELARPVPVVGTGDPVIGVAATEVRWTRRTGWLTYGMRSLLEGQVVTVDGALPNAEVRLYARPVGWQRWNHISSRRTSTDTGLFRFGGHKPIRNTDYRVDYVPEWAYAASSGFATVKVRRKITSTVTRNTDGTFTMKGAIAPKSPGKTIRLQRKKCQKCSWSTIKSTTASRWSTWRFRFSGPRRGTWYFRAFTPRDPRFLAGFSGSWAIRR